MSRVDRGFFLSAMLTIAELSAACAPRNAPVLTATPIVRPYTPDSLPSMEFLAIAARIDPLVQANSERQVWENGAKIAAIVNEAYCLAFPGCIRPAPKVEFLSLREFSDRLQSDDTTRYRYPDKEVQDFYVNILENRTIIVNKDNRSARISLQQRLFSNIASNLPAFLLEQQLFADRNQRRKINLSLHQQGVEYTFDQVYGFTIENSRTGLKFTYLQQAAAVLVKQDLQRRMGMVLTTSSSKSEATAQHLAGKMGIAQVSLSELVGLHRQSDLNNLLIQLYPNSGDENQRMIVAMRDFNIVYELAR